MKIALATADFPPIEGGLSRLSTDLARYLDLTGNLSGVLAPKLEGAEDFDGTAPYPVYRAPGYGWGVARLAPGFLGSGKFRSDVLARSDRLLAINPSFGGGYGVLLKKLGHPIPFTVFAYGYEFLKFEGSKTSPGRRILEKVYEEASEIVAISRFTRDRLIEFGVPAKKLRICPLGVDLTRFKPEEVPGVAREKIGVDPDSPVLLSVGRLIPRKRNLLVLRCLLKLKERFPGIAYWIVGRGPEEKKLKDFVQENGLGDHVRFWGKIDDEILPSLYQACDVFLLPAVHEGPSVEGLGLVLQEAAACGKPTIGANTGGIPEAMIEGKTGALVPPDDETALTEALTDLLENPDRGRALGTAGHDWVSAERDWKVCVGKLKGILETEEPSGKRN